MYRSITGNTELDYEFGYGPAMYNPVNVVQGIHKSWSHDFSADDLSDTERADVSLCLFYKEAAERGQAVICGISYFIVDSTVDVPRCSSARASKSTTDKSHPAS